ncbi:MAG: hypothetical protein KDK76_03890 [Chlamydiia bacterium]|nr:hypothetical protein [Chlamydiia bacterium]
MEAQFQPQNNNQRTFYQAVLEDRWGKPNPTLQNGNTKALLAGLSLLSITTAGIGLKFFKMDKDIAAVTGGAGLLLGASALTERDGFLYIFALGVLTATGISVVKAMKEGRVYVDLANILRLAWDIYRGR